MTVGKAGRILAALILVGLLASGCTTPPPPPPTPSASQTPTESAIERQQQLDYEAAEKSYRTFRAEISRVAKAGGSSRATTAMKATAGGPYLDEYVNLLRAFKEGAFHDEGDEKIVLIRRGGYSNNALILDTCEDSRSVITYDANQEVFGKGELRTAKVEVRKSGNFWRVWQGDGKKVNKCA